MNSPSMDGGVEPRFILEDENPHVFEPVRIRLSGIEPGQPIRLIASCVDSNHQLFVSWAAYHGDTRGIIDVSRQFPFAGTYQGIAPFGLWWSMESSRGLPFARDLRPIATTIEAQTDGKLVAQCKFVRTRVSPGVTVTHVRWRDIRGTFFEPQLRSLPGVIVLGGSEGGSACAEELAALIAANGFPALALAYFGFDDLEKTLVGIPLERIEAAANWVLRHTAPSFHRLGIVGMSRGAELALLVATLLPEVAAVVALSPSSVVWPGMNLNSAVASAAWTLGGAPVTFARPLTDGTAWLAPGSDPFELKSLYQEALREGTTKDFEIPVERIKGAVLLVSGGDDAIWPSQQMGEAIMARLTKFEHPFEYEHLIYDEAGHGVARPPGLPSPPTIRNVSKNLRPVLLGGTPSANALSGVAAWPRIIDFLSRSLVRDTSL